MSLTIYVDEWPKRITTPTGTIFNPSPETCQAHGYELTTPEMRDQRNQERQQALQDAEQAELQRQQEVEALRTAYRDSATKFCTLAGIEPTQTKFEDATLIQTKIEQANDEQDFVKALGLTQLSLAMQHILTDLRRKDGDDAWDRI